MKKILSIAVCIVFYFSVYSQNILSWGKHDICLGDTTFIGAKIEKDTIYNNSLSVNNLLYIPDDSDSISGNGISSSALFILNVNNFPINSIINGPNNLGSICIDIEHSFVGDLDIIVTCPNGQTLDLINFSLPTTINSDFGFPAIGISSTNYGTPLTYCWDPLSSNPPITNQSIFGSQIPPNTYQPVQNWSSLIGCPLNGQWSIEILDDYGGDDGFVFGVELSMPNLVTDSIINIIDSIGSWDFNPSIISNNNANEIVVYPTTPGEHYFNYYTLDMFGDSIFYHDTINVIDLQLNLLSSDSVFCLTPIDLIADVNSSYVADSCDYKLDLFDSFGDGWSGAELSVFIDSILDTVLTIPLGGSILSYSFKILENTHLYLEYTPGLNNSDNSFNLYNSENVNVFSSGSNLQTGIVFNEKLFCNDISFQWSPNYFITDTSLFEVQVQPLNNVAYTLEVTLEGACTKGESIFIETCINDIGTYNICQDDSIEINGVSYFLENHYSDTLTTFNGLDSVILFNIVVSGYTFSQIDTIYLCNYDSFEYNGNIYNSIGFYKDTFSMSLSCDSIYQFEILELNEFIDGFITDVSGIPIGLSKAYLIQIDLTDSSLIFIDSTLTDNFGYFNFPYYSSETFIKVIPNPVNYTYTVPTYFSNSSTIQNANFCSPSCDSLNFNFSVVSVVSNLGSSFISGIVGNGVGKNSEIGLPISGLSLLLMNENMEVVKQTYTDVDGKFMFDNLDVNLFSIWVDKPFINNLIAPSISLLDESSKEDLQFILHEDYLEYKNTVSIKDIKESSFKVFPNPTNGLINIQSHSLEFKIELYNILGEVVFSNENIKGNTILDLNKSEILKGLMFLKYLKQIVTFTLESF